MKYIAELAVVAAWIFGVVLAKGFWSTLLAAAVPIWSFYLVAEYVLARP